MKRIDIVTALMAAAVSSNFYGAVFMGERDIEACERLADGIIAYDEAYQSVKEKEEWAE